MESVKLIECPRDAMQGLKDFVPTVDKVKYLNTLLGCGFDTLDFGSFVSPKAIPQMRDTAEVLNNLTTETQTKLLAIVANERGAEEACSFDRIDFLGYPFSVSEEFQRRNTNSSIEGSLGRVQYIKDVADRSGKKLVLYLSMGFGNPYGEEWTPGLVLNWSNRLYNEFGIEILAISDTIGAANPTVVRELFSALIPSLPSVEFGAHLHTRKEHALDLVEAAWHAGCRRFDGAIGGIGGCPMAKDDLTGNMPTEIMLNWFNEQKIHSGVNLTKFEEARGIASRILPVY